MFLSITIVSFGQNVIDPDDDGDSDPAVSDTLIAIEPIDYANDKVILYEEGTEVNDEHPVTVVIPYARVTDGTNSIMVDRSKNSFFSYLDYIFVTTLEDSYIKIDCHWKYTLNELDTTYNIYRPANISMPPTIIPYDSDSLLFIFAETNKVYFYKGNFDSKKINLNTSVKYSLPMSESSDINSIKGFTSYDLDNNPITYIIIGQDNYHLYVGYSNEFTELANLGEASNVDITDGYIANMDTTLGNVHIAKLSENNIYLAHLNTRTNALSSWTTIANDAAGNSLGFVKNYVFNDTYTSLRQYISLYYINTFDNRDSIYWLSDKLEQIGYEEDVLEGDNALPVTDLLAVIEGPAPFPLNGYTIQDLSGASKFEFGYKQGILYDETTGYASQTSVTTVKNKGLSASIGIPLKFITLGLSGSYSKKITNSTITYNETTQSFTESHTMAVNTTVEPPLANEEGSMVYIYIAPSLSKSTWELFKPDGSEYSPKRFVIFYDFTSPQIRIEKKSLSEFDESPSIFDFNSYTSRYVENFEGINDPTSYSITQDIASGISQSVNVIDFQSQTSSSSRTTNINNDVVKGWSFGLGLSADSFKIASFSLGFKLGKTTTTRSNKTYEYARNFTVLFENSFRLSYNLPTPSDPSDPDNVRSFTTNLIISKADNDAYFMEPKFYGTNPYFITYEVKNVETGSFLTPVEENMSLNIYPNPVRDNLYLDNLPANSTLQITDMQGKTVIQTAAHGQTLDVSNLKPGIYFIKVESEKGVYTSKLIKE